MEIKSDFLITLLYSQIVRGGVRNTVKQTQKKKYSRKEMVKSCGNNAAKVWARPKEYRTPSHRRTLQGTAARFIIGAFFSIVIFYNPSCSLIDSRTMRSYSCEKTICQCQAA
jgi:hypothetical protein